MNKLIVKEGKYGRGVFNLEAIKKGTLVECCPVLPLPRGNIQQLKPGTFSIATDSVRDGDINKQLDRYVFDWSDELHALALGYGSIYNHSANHPNLRAVPDFENNDINFYATKDLEAGTELMYDYTYDPSRRPAHKNTEIKMRGLLAKINEWGTTLRIRKEEDEENERRFLESNEGKNYVSDRASENLYYEELRKPEELQDKEFLDAFIKERDDENYMRWHGVTKKVYEAREKQASA